jgi:pimeloyl-ACP methyl ester carboxylesterase
MSAIIIEDKIVHYEVLGRGKPIVFLHGWVGSWRYWIPTMQAASTSYRAYAIDLWGFGDTAKDSSFYSLEQQTELIDRFLNEMGIGKVALVGHGLGAVVALLYAAKHAFVVDRIMVIGLPLSKEDLHERFSSDAPTDLVSWILNQTPTAEAAKSEAPKTDDAAIKASLEDLQFMNLLDISKQLDTASLLVHGANDPAIRVPNLDSNGELPSMVHHITFGESGHFPMLDQPNKFHRLMNDFLDLDPGASPQQLQLKEEWKRRVR